MKTRFCGRIDKNLILILTFVFITSMFLCYSYIDFSANMSIGEGYAYTAKSLALSRNYNVNEYWGNSGIDIYKFNGNYYVAYAPLTPLLMAIPYFLLQSAYFIYTNTVSPVNGDLSILLESWAFGLPSSLALIGIGAVFAALVSNKARLFYFSLPGLLLGTLLLNYSVTFFNHLISAFFVFTAYYFLVKERLFFLSGILTGLAFLAEHPSILFSIAVGIYLLTLVIKGKSEVKTALRNLLFYALGVIPFILLMLIFNKHNNGGYFTFAEQLLHDYKSNIVGMETHSFSENPLYGLFGQYLHPLKGLFLYSPFLVFSFYFMYKNFRKPRVILALTHVLIISVVYAMWSDCWGASAYGARYLITTIPFWALWAYEGVSMLGKTWQRIYIVLIIYGITIAVLNASIGVAWDTFGKCKMIYAPIKRIQIQYLMGKPPIIKSALLEYLRR